MPPTAKTTKTSLLRIEADSGEVLFELNRDGTMEFGMGYEPDDAARRFWEAMVSQSEDGRYMYDLIEQNNTLRAENEQLRAQLPEPAPADE